MAEYLRNRSQVTAMVDGVGGEEVAELVKVHMDALILAELPNQDGYGLLALGERLGISSKTLLLIVCRLLDGLKNFHGGRAACSGTT